MIQHQINDKTLRYMNIGYPLLRVQASIHLYKDTQDYPLIKEYIYKLVTGGQAEEPNPIAYVENRLQAFQLLGLDNELYDIANYYYDQLIMEGKIHERNQKPLAGAAAADDPEFIRLRTSRQVLCSLIVDPYSGEILNPRWIKHLRTLDYATDSATKYHPLEFIYRPEELETKINERNFSFDHSADKSLTSELLRKNMPPGTRRIELVETEYGSSVEVFWLPFILVWQKTEEGRKFDLFGDGYKYFMINDVHHRELQRYLQTFFDQEVDMQYNLSLNLGPEKISIPIQVRDGGSIKLAPNVSMDGDGNYILSLTDEQLQRICQDHNSRTAAKVLKKIIRGVFDAEPLRGRLIRVFLTDEQCAFCAETVKKMETVNAVPAIDSEQIPDSDDLEMEEPDQEVLEN